ncbi:unnamed protein product [Adineta steineri]|uniref:RGS domain-containing protein n=1 Tax=Adineta steineri TaxID=433720 RepID=A0A814MGW6_9BILA|nr:unnamed protein product [Adineta steineri]
MPEQSSASVTDSCSIHDFDELLSLDDIFVDYFNEFLRSGMFVHKLEYNRELNTFIEKPNDKLLNLTDENISNIIQKPSNEIDTLSVFSGFSDTIQLDEVPDEIIQKTSNSQKLHQAQIMEWVKNERLGLFWRTELYRQYKLCKLLLRPLITEKEPSVHSSQGIGGYSRQSVYTAARTLSTENSNATALVRTATVEEDDEQEDLDQSEHSSNSNMMFENNIMASELLRMPRPILRPGSRAYSVPANIVRSLSLFFPNNPPKQSGKMSKRSSSSKTSQRKSIPKDDENISINDPNDPGSLSLFSSVKVRYFDESDNDEENEDITNFGLQVESSSSQVKYKHLGSHKGMQSFAHFLQTTKGGYELYRFWMDCEFFKDTMTGLDQIENVVARTRLFRDLNDGKYHLPFMRHLQNKIRRAYAETAGVLTHDVFFQVQYDVLRRLRMYWSARFIIHELFQQHHHHHSHFQFPTELKQPAKVCLYPIDHRAKANLVEMTRVFLSNDYTTNEMIIPDVRNEEFYDESEESFNNTFMRKYTNVIRKDKQSGGLFLRYITFSERRLLPLILFCYDVDDFRYSNLDDKILESQHGLSILNTYFGNSAKLSLDQFMPDIQINRWVETFHQLKFDKLSFEPLFKRALLILKDTWLRCIKEDVDSFTVAYYIPASPLQIAYESEEEEKEINDVDGNEQRSGSSVSKRRLQRICSPATQIQISDETIYIKRPWLDRFLSSATRKRQAELRMELTEEERERLRAERLERLRIRELNRKKALKAARERRRRANEKGDGSGERTRRYPGFYIDEILPTPTASLAKDVQRLFLNGLQRHLKTNKTASPKLEHKLCLVFEIAKWMDLTNPYEKQQHIDRMKKTYFDPHSKRNVFPLTDEQNEILNANNGRPDQMLFELLFRDLRIELEEEFVNYCEDRIKIFEIDSIDDFISQPLEELTALFNRIEDGLGLDDEDEFDTLFGPDAEASASNDDGTGKATKKHYSELYQLLSDATIGRFNERFYYFYAYLTHWVDAKKAPYLDQDFLFCIDVSRLKEIANDATLQSKLRYIIETYLESTIATNNYTCRLDLTNVDLQVRMLRALQKSIQANIHDFSSLEEARTTLIKDVLVYYYAGFKAYLVRMDLSKKRPKYIVKLQEKLALHQQLSASRLDKTSTTRSTPSLPNKNIPPTIRKAPSGTSKQQKLESTAPADITTVTKTQYLLNERTKAFETLAPIKANDVAFPDISKTTGQGSAATSKLRTAASQDAQGTSTDRLNSEKEKKEHRGPVTIQYTLTSGLIIKYSDGRSAVEGAHSGSGVSLQQPRESVTYSAGSIND